MKKTTFKSLLALFACMLVLGILLTSCGKGSDIMMDSENAVGKPSAGDVGFGDVNVTVDSSQVAERKVIKTFYISAETKEYDAAVTSLQEMIAAHGGYVESASSSDKSMNNNSNTYTRYASYTVRVPAENADAFVSSVGGMLNVTSNRSTVEDVSDTYYSIEARLEELRVERESLLEIQKSIDNQKDYNFWLTIQQRLSEVKQQISVYQGQLNRYDGQIAYSTVNLELREVLAYSALNQNNDFGSRLGAAFREGWTNFVIFCQDFTIWFAEALPTLILLGLIATGIVLIIRRVKAKKKARRAEADSQAVPESGKQE